MPRIIQQVVAWLVQMAVVWFSSWLAAHGGPTFTDDQLTKFVADATPIVLMAGWAIWQIFRNRQKQLVAQASPGPVSEHHVEQAVAAGAAPSVMTKPHEVPTLKA